MARTAPIPNIPAIPGMNPGVFVMGGGGTGGGGSGPGKKGGAGGQGADGENGGSGAEGGGKGADSCGAGSGGTCPNPAHGSGNGTTAGDPVDPMTGRVYTTPASDLALPGTIPLIIARSYSTSLIWEDVGLGHGWTHSLAWAIDEARRTLRVREPGANTTIAPKPDEDGSVRLPCGLVRRHAWGYSITAKGLLYTFAEQRDRRWLLSRILDRQGNAISLHYEGGKLASILDSVGRVVRVRRHPDGHIAAFEVKNASSQGRWTSFRTYEYSDRNDLVAARDGEGRAMRFEYDEDHRLVRRREAGGLVAEFRYDEGGRCVESFCQRAEDGLDAGLPEVLADHTTPAKGFLHVRLEHGVDSTEVITSRTHRRIKGSPLEKPELVTWSGGAHTFRYDEGGELTEYVDALGNTQRSVRDAAGRVVRSIDPIGAVTEYVYNDDGDVVEMRDAMGGAARYEWDDRGNVLSVHDDLGLVVAYRYDSRGLLIEGTMPNGGVTRMAYDALANRVEVVEPDGGTRRVRYDFLGRVTALAGEGGETLYHYDGCGRVREIRLPSGATERYDYDDDGRLARLIDADGRATLLRWGGIGVVTEVVRPDGRIVRYRYDREQDLTRVINEAGEEHVFTRSGEGRIVAERTFDGRTISYRHDGMGQITQIRAGSRAVELKYDACGRLIERSYSDGRKDEIEYDLLGRMTRVTNGEVTCRYTRDARGRTVREEVTQDGHAAVTELTYDSIGNVAQATGPFGAMSIARDLVGRPIEVAFGDVAPVRLSYDAAGSLLERALPQGGRIVQRPTADGFVGQVQVLSPRALPRVRSGDPEWVGRNPLGQTFARSYERSPGGLLTAIEGLEDERTELPRDASGRVIERRRVNRSHATMLEAFGYGASGDLYEPSKRRSYAPGGRLTEHGDARYVYDEGGRVTQKRMADGSVWDFEWGDNDWLNAVRTPDGRTIRFSYDSFARRTTKQIERDGRIESVTRYAWNGDALAREVREVAQAGGDPVVEERVYAALPGSVLPLAHRDVVSGKASEYRYYVEAPNGAPDALIAGDGTVVGTLDASLYGRVEGDQAALTPLRLPGHYADPETGLHYNRYRYYDPAAGQYLSPEPIRLEGSLRAYAYAEGSPTEIVDLDGLNPDSLPMQGTITGTTSGGDDITGQGTSGYDPDWKKKLHPAVQQALPKTPAPPKEGKFERNPAVCAEPKAMSDYLKKWEEKTGKSADPSTEEGKKNLQQALKDVKNIESKWDGDNKVKQACPNCSQTLPRLWKLAGLDPNDPEHGLNKKMPAGGTSATTPPGWGKPFKPDYKNDSKYPSDDLGKWHYNNGKWEQL